MKPGSRYEPWRHRSCVVRRASRRPARPIDDDPAVANQHIAFDHVEGVVHRDDGGAASADRLAKSFEVGEPSQRGGLERLGLAAPDGDQLGGDADGDLLRRDGAEVEADRRVNALEQRGIDVRSSASSCS